MMPGESGLSLTEEQKKKDSTPIILLTAKGEAQERIEGLEVGADDYVVKPFSPKELMARIDAVMRRSHPERRPADLAYQDVVLDLEKHRVTRDGNSIHLGPKEFRILRILMEKPGRVFSREQLLDRVWGRDIYVEIRTVDVHIRRLRKALNLGGHQDLIRTVRSAGYSLDAEKH